MSMVETAFARESARRLLDRVEALASRLEYGAASLVGRRVAVVSPAPGDAMLARLLLAFGATPTFLGPTLPSCADAELVQSLSFLLTDQRKSLDAASFAAPEGHGIPVHTWPPATGQVEAFDLVLALGAIPAEPQQATAALNALVQLVKVGGDLELFGSLPEATARAVREHAAPLSLGIRIAERDPWRLSLTRLAEPLAEYPVEESSDGVILAHCLSRLHFARQFVADRDVLEAGCATGIGARLFAAAGARRVLGLDLHPELIDRARLLTTDSRIEFRQADLDQPLPCADESFDVVVCTEVLEHITNQEGAVREFLRVLRPGGRLIVSVPSKDYEDGWAEVNRYGNPYHLHVPTAEELNRLLAPFASVRHFRQLDAVGSVVLAADDLRPAGEFSTPVGNLPSEVRSVRLVVCTKEPAGEELSPPPALLLHRCFSDYQLAAHQHSRNLRAEILHLRHTAWAEQNRQRNEFEERLQEQRNEFEERLQEQRAEFETELKDPAAHLWRSSFGPLVLDRAPECGPLLAALAEALRPLPAPPEAAWLDFPPQHLRLLENGKLQLVAMPYEAAAFPVHTVLFPFPETHLSFGTLWRWRRRGARSFWFFEGNRWRILDAEAAVLRRLYRKGPGRALRLLGRVLPVNAARWERALVRRVVARRGRSSCPERVVGIDGGVNPRLWPDWVARDNEKWRDGIRVPTGRPLRVLQYAGGLYSGGAERQLCNVAIGLAERGVEVAVRTTYEPTADRGHYVPLLARHGMEVRQAGLDRRADLGVDEADLLGRLPSHLADQVRELCAELLHYRPDVLHCWLDSPNIVGALAGLLAGVPRILLSMRNSNPTHFPRFYQPSMKEWYPIVLASARVHVLSNSRSGAASYAEWLGVPYDRFHLVANGMHFGHFPEASDANRRAAREAFGLHPADRVVCGVFRLDEEKQPEVFLRVVEEVERRVPRLRVLLAGTGAMAAEVEEMVRERGLDRFLTLLGRREQVGEVLLASDAMLLTSKVEGCPNAVLESQYMGVPVVATRGGGTADSILHGETGYLADVGDVATLADHLTEVLSNDRDRAAFGIRAQEFIRTEFALDRMVDLTLLAYHRMYEASGRRVMSPVVARLEADVPDAAPVLPAAPVVASFTQRSITPPAILTPPPDAETERPELTAEETREVEAVEGHFHLWDAQGVHRLARLARGPVVELGSYLGKSTLALLLGAAKSKQRVHAVDPWFPSNPDVLGYEHTRLFGIDDYLGFCAHVRAHRDRLTVVATRGRDVAWQGPPIGALFIDAIHTYEEVRADFHHYLPHLAPRARVAFHDFLPERTAFPGVLRFIEGELLTSGEWRWDDFRGALLTVERVRRSRKVIEHNRRCLEAARQRIRDIARQHEEMRRAG